jgi:hypothetical protein
MLSPPKKEGAQGTPKKRTAVSRVDEYMRYGVVHRKFPAKNNGGESLDEPVHQNNSARKGVDKKYAAFRRT